MSLSTIKEAIVDIKSGRMIILVDDEDRENEGDLCMAAEFIRHTLASIPSTCRSKCAGLQCVQRCRPKRLKRV